ncbi:CLOCK-interacting pacemaker isoform X1 [Heteronotia binoei]|uniref:CLOCK-interacting pacemaker isoform X1 n=1 Tax=Heteronotia binoei TaxID=13085 RepID=UPI0029315700|nr:CLOCK-interacting pacemaker isoform X1 [Heteronotia binoei]XP_060118710.1 CLOCK-interacting pacemaker isoform X1 [Heteronotia binoei]
METKRQSHPFGSATAELDKDSGFSDGSLDYLSSAEPANSEDALRASWHSPAAAFSPVVVMKNAIIRQEENSSQFQSWTAQPLWETIPTHPPLVVLHPPIPSAVTLQAAREKKGDSSDLLSILNSYAKIALQPYKRDLEDREETSRQKRLCTGRTDTSPNQVSSLPSGLCHQGPLALRPSWNFLRQDVPGQNAAAVHGFQHVSIAKSKALGCTPASSTPASPASQSQARGVAQPVLCNPLVLRKELGSSSGLPLQQPSKSKHFQNTLVLHKSGLLDITLKTKNLISQNLVTQVELDWLKQQTQLFMEALKNNASQAWAELEASLRQSNKAMNSLLTSPGI